MKEAIIVTLTPAEQCFDELLQLMGDVLGETRAFDGCKMAHVYHSRADNEIFLVQLWEDGEAHDDYLNWRAETGIFDKIGPLLEREQVHRSFEAL